MIALLLALALDSQSTAKPDAAVVAAVLAAEDARFAAMVSADMAVLESSLDPSLTYHHSTGAAQSKAEFIGAIRDGILKYKAIDVIERRLRRIGSVSIVTGVIRIQVSSGSETIDTRARFTDIYETRDGRLIQVAWQNTRMP